jgi:calcium channel MID1
LDVDRRSGRNELDVWTGAARGRNDSVCVCFRKRRDTAGGVKLRYVHLSAGQIVIQYPLTMRPGPIHSITTSQPFLGDTTNSTALIFSPLLQDSPHYQPTYPNYTLPPAQLVLPSFSSSTDNMVSNATFVGPAPNLTLIMVPTGSSPTQDGLDHSLCAIRAANSSTGSVASPSNMIVNRTEPSWVAVDGEEGYRQYWVVGNLVSGSNYTAWAYDEDKQSLSPPIWLATKDGE